MTQLLTIIAIIDLFITFFMIDNSYAIYFFITVYIPMTMILCIEYKERLIMLKLRIGGSGGDFDNNDQKQPSIV